MPNSHLHISGLSDLEQVADVPTALARIRALYNQATDRISDRFTRFVNGEREGDPVHDACYPYLGIAVAQDDLVYDGRPAWGTLPFSGVYGTTLTRPDLFEKYYADQLKRLVTYHKAPLIVGRSNRPIPLAFVIEQATAGISPADIRTLGNIFAMPELARIDDTIVNGVHRPAPDAPLPLAHFSAERVDLALQRLRHYTGTEPHHFQGFVLFTNYQRYVDEFIAYARDQVAAGRDGHVLFAAPGGFIQHKGDSADGGTLPTALPQMPAYHLVREDGLGVTLINIGVGPSNAKTITDHLAVLRPHCWLMIGHCGGLRRSQQLGDYVLAHAYVRDDHVLDADLPPWVPVPPIAEVQVALTEAVARVTGLEGPAMKTRLRTGTVVSTDDRNWELKVADLYTRFNQSRAIAIDMESATIAANGFRLRVPYGTLLCVSDKPLHGELKLRGMANAFYQQRVSQHLAIGLEAIRIVRDEQGIEGLHSRKLRSFDEPAFR